MGDSSFGCAGIGERFSYMPPSSVAALGQEMELWPVVSGSNPRVFAIAPPLPRGLSIDKFTGVVRGVPQQTTTGNSTHFVTCCEPLAHFSISIAVIHLNILSSATPVDQSANLLQHVLGVSGVNVHAGQNFL